MIASDVRAIIDRELPRSIERASKILARKGAQVDKNVVYTEDATVVLAPEPLDPTGISVTTIGGVPVLRDPLDPTGISVTTIGGVPVLRLTC